MRIEKQINADGLWMKLVAFITSLIFAFTLTFWSQSIIAEVYTLNSFFVVLLIYILLCWAEATKNQESKKSIKQENKINESSEISKNRSKEN